MKLLRTFIRPGGQFVRIAVGLRFDPRLTRRLNSLAMRTLRSRLLPALFFPQRRAPATYQCLSRYQ